MTGKNPLELDPARPITIDGIDYMIEGRQGSDLALFNTLTGQTLTMTYSAVMRRAGLSDIPLQAVGEIGAAEEHLPTHRKRHLSFMRRQAEEVAYGKPHDVAEYREGYDPETTTLDERLKRKAAEFAALDIPGGSYSNLKKQVRRLKRQGPAGLLDGRSTRTVDPFAGIDQRLYQLMVARVNEAKDKSTASAQQLMTDVRCDWIAQHPGELDVLPSDSTLRRKFEILTHGRYTTGSAINRRSNEGVRRRYMAHRPAYAPGDEVQLDSTVLDVTVRKDDGTTCRPTVTSLIDKATHSIFAIMLTFVASGVDLAYLLAKALSIPVLRPGPELPPDVATELRWLPWAELLLEEELRGKDQARPIIPPRRIITDLGKDMQSDAFLSACRTFGVDITFAAPGTGTDKPIVERYHKALKDLFSRNFAGFSGGNAGDRGRHIEDEPGIVSIHTLAYVLDLWVRHVWQNLETDALRDPAHPSVRYSPNTMYEALTYRTGSIFTPITPNTYISLLPTEVRTVDRMGLHLMNRRYDCPELDPYRGKPSGDKLIGDRWRVHYDPNNPSAVWLGVPPLDSFPAAGEFVECPWANLEAFEAPFERAVAESAENIATLGYQIPRKDRSLRSRQFVKGATAAAEKEERAAAEREAKDRLAAEQGMARPRPRTVVEPEDPAGLWTQASTAEAYGLFDPQNAGTTPIGPDDTEPDRD